MISLPVKYQDNRAAEDRIAVRWLNTRDGGFDKHIAIAFLLCDDQVALLFDIKAGRHADMGRKTQVPFIAQHRLHVPLELDTLFRRAKHEKKRDAETNEDCKKIIEYVRIINKPDDQTGDSEPWDEHETKLPPKTPAKTTERPPRDHVFFTSPRINSFHERDFFSFRRKIYSSGETSMITGIVPSSLPQSPPLHIRKNLLFRRLAGRIEIQHLLQVPVILSGRVPFVFDGKAFQVARKAHRIQVSCETSISSAFRMASE